MRSPTGHGRSSSSHVPRLAEATVHVDPHEHDGHIETAPGRWIPTGRMTGAQAPSSGRTSGGTRSAMERPPRIRRRTSLEATAATLARKRSARAGSRKRAFAGRARIDATRPSSPRALRVAHLGHRERAGRAPRRGRSYHAGRRAGGALSEPSKTVIGAPGHRSRAASAWSTSSPCDARAA